MYFSIVMLRSNLHNNSLVLNDVHKDTITCLCKPMFIMQTDFILVRILGAISLVRLLFWSILLFTSLSSYAEGRWQKLSSGIDYQDINSRILSPWTHIYAFRI